MLISSFLTLCGGLAFFLYGMLTVSEHLERLSGGRLARLLRAASASPGRGLLLGAAATAALQSSSALTVLLVGLADAGILEAEQTAGVIMGSNIGTTLTPWLLALPGGASLLTPESLSPLLALLGVALVLGAKKRRRRDAGRILVGFSVLFSGMELMRQALRPLAELPEFTRLLTAFEDPLSGVLAGAAFTAVIQSSAAAVGMLQALALSGTVTCAAALPLVMGQNIGTCATALLSAAGAGRGGRRVAAIHVAFNAAGSAVCLALVYGGAVPRTLLERPVSPAGVAALHTAFNVFSAALFFPLLQWRYKKARNGETSRKRKRREFPCPLRSRTARP